MAVVKQAGVPRLSFDRFRREAVRWLAESWFWALGAALVSFVVGWAWNTYLMAKDLEGSFPPPGSETTATAEGKGGNFFYWMLAFSILFGIAAYIRGRGLRNALADAKRLPTRLINALSGNPVACVALAAWGAGLALFLAVVLTKAMAGLFSLGFLLALPTAVATIINGTLIRLWGSLAVRLAPVNNWRLDPIGAPAAMAVGQIVAFLIAWQIGSPIIKMFLAILAVGASVVLALTAQKPTPAQVAGLFVVAAGAAVLYDLVNGGGVAYADDGGWLECFDPDTGQPCAGQGLRGVLVWFTSPGADKLISRGLIGGMGAMFGGLLGTSVGGAVGRTVRVGRIRPVRLTGAEAQQFLTERGLLVPQENGQLVLREDAAKISRGLAGQSLEPPAQLPSELEDTVTLQAGTDPLAATDPGAPPTQPGAPAAPAEPTSVISNAEIKGATGRFVDLDTLEVELEIEDPVPESAIEPEPIAEPPAPPEPGVGIPAEGGAAAGATGTAAAAGTDPAAGTPATAGTPTPPPPPPADTTSAATPPPPPAAPDTAAQGTPTPPPPPPPPPPPDAGAGAGPIGAPEPAGAGAGPSASAGDPGSRMGDFGEGRQMGDFGEGRQMGDFGEGQSMDEFGEGRRMEDFGEGERMEDFGGAEGPPPDEPEAPGEGLAERARRAARRRDGGGGGGTPTPPPPPPPQE